MTPLEGNWSAYPPIGLAPKILRGRDSVVRHLCSEVSHAEGTINVLCGLGGVGKSAIALEVVRWAQAQNIHTWWITINDQESIVGTVLRIIRDEALGTSEHEMRSASESIVGLADVFWSRLRVIGGRWLLVIDQVDDPNVLNIGRQALGEGRG